MDIDSLVGHHRREAGALPLNKYRQHAAQVYGAPAGFARQVQLGRSRGGSADHFVNTAAALRRPCGAPQTARRRRQPRLRHDRTQDPALARAGEDPMRLPGNRLRHCLLRAGQGSIPSVLAVLAQLCDGLGVRARIPSPVTARSGARRRPAAFGRFVMAKDFAAMEDSNRSANPSIHDVSDPARRLVLRGGLGAPPCSGRSGRRRPGRLCATPGAMPDRRWRRRASASPPCRRRRPTASPSRRAMSPRRSCPGASRSASPARCRRSATTPATAPTSRRCRWACITTASTTSRSTAAGAACW